MSTMTPAFAALDTVVPAPWGAFGAEGAIAAGSFPPAIGNYYMTDPISRSSATMAKCTKLFAADQQARTGTHG
jgi:NADH-quinone oxidoreductase subunit G